jgi:bacterioferritin-associated ferredoxin
VEAGREAAEERGGVFVCVCKGITETAVQRLGESGCVTPERIMESLGLRDDDCCGRCADDIDEFAAIAQDAALITWVPAGTPWRPALLAS